jgi:glycerophosphoryl diester phosphodiesterase
LQDLFQHTREPLPWVSAHRGGAQKNFPENCIATFENTLKHTFAIMEIDPRYAKDGSIVLNHDAGLERTTTGKGLVAERTLKELKQLRLKDSEGNITEFQISTLDEALEWARGKTILVLDQKDVPVAARVKKIEEHKAEAYAMLIVSNFKDARACYALNRNIMMEVMIPDRKKAADFDKTGVPWRNIVAFVGHTPPQDAALYELIHEKGTNCMVGSSRNLDLQVRGKQGADAKRLAPDYRALLQRGADLIETDLPVLTGSMLFSATPVPSSKQKCFHRE